MAIGHERDVVLVRFAEADARIEADSLACDAGRDERVAPLAQILADFRNDVGVGRVVLHRLRRALHVHRANAGRRIDGDLHHFRIAFQAGDVVDDFRAGLDRGAGNRRLAGIDGNRHRHLRARAAR